MTTKIKQSWFEMDEDYREEHPETAPKTAPKTSLQTAPKTAPKAPIKPKLKSSIPLNLGEDIKYSTPCTTCYYCHPNEKCDFACQLCGKTGSHTTTCKMYENPQKLLISLNVSCTNLRLDLDDLPTEMKDFIDYVWRYMDQEHIGTHLFPFVCRNCSRFHEDDCKSVCRSCRKCGFHARNCRMAPKASTLAESITNRSMALSGKLLKIAKKEIDNIMGN